MLQLLRRRSQRLLVAGRRVGEGSVEVEDHGLDTGGDRGHAASRWSWVRADRGTGRLVHAGAESARLSPSGNIAYQARTGLWIAQKQGGPWLLGASSEPWSLFVASGDYLTLYLRLNLKALTELAAEFGDWYVACEPGTSIWSATGPTSPGEPAGLTFRAPTLVELVHQVRGHLVSIGAGDTEPWFRLLDDPGDRE